MLAERQLQSTPCVDGLTLVNLVACVASRGDLVVTGLKFPLICPNLAMCTSVCVPGPTGRGITFHCLTDIDMFLRNENSSFVQKMSRGITMGRQT